MYRMIIVDDEKVIRGGLVDLIPWESMGFRVVADFEDGREAISYLQRNETHVVLTDIRMTEIGGLELAEWIYTHMPQVKVVVISGYKEFDYARQAIKFNVSCYLLKPTKLDEIESAFMQLRRELDGEKHAFADHKRSQEWLLLLREQFFTDLLMGALRNSTELAARMNRIELPHTTEDGCYVADMHLRPNDAARLQDAEDKQFLISGLSKLLKQQNESIVRLYPVPNQDAGLKVVAIWGRQVDLQTGAHLAGEQLRSIIESAQSVYDFTIELRAEQTYESLSELAGHSDKVRLASEERDGKIRLEAFEYERLVPKYKLFISNVIEGNADEVSSLLDRFLDEFREVPASFTHRLIKDLFAIIQHTLSESGMDVKQLTGKVLDYDMAYHPIDEIRVLSKHTVTEVMQTISSNKNDSSKSLIEQARQYIQERYHQDISLDNVADQVFLHPVYFSKLFKQHAGVNFSEYLTALRITKAMELIQTRQYKMYEVGTMVGYPNSKYFYRVFKQSTGYTPTEYAELVQEGTPPV